MMPFGIWTARSAVDATTRKNPVSKKSERIRFHLVAGYVVVAPESLFFEGRFIGGMFKEADTALIGWEAYARKEMRDGRRGIILDAQATKYKNKEDAKQIGPDAGKADYHAELQQFLTSVRKREAPKCGAVEGMRAAVVGIVANEAVREGGLRKFKKEDFEV